MCTHRCLNDLITDKGSITPSSATYTINDWNSSSITLNTYSTTAVKNVSGDTVIDGSSNFLKVSSHSGSIDVYVGDGGSAELHSQEGAVSVRVPSSLTAGVELRGASVDVSSEVVLHGVKNNTTEGHTTLTGYMNSKSPVDHWVKAQADRGSVRLNAQSWFESLRLGN